jgi:hypothetical protein
MWYLLPPWHGLETVRTPNDNAPRYGSFDDDDFGRRDDKANNPPMIGMSHRIISSSPVLVLTVTVLVTDNSPNFKRVIGMKRGCMHEMVVGLLKVPR